MDVQENQMIVIVMDEDFNECDVADCVELISLHGPLFIPWFSSVWFNTATSSRFLCLFLSLFSYLLFSDRDCVGTHTHICNTLFPQDLQAESMKHLVLNVPDKVENNT